MSDEMLCVSASVLHTSHSVLDHNIWNTGAEQWWKTGEEASRQTPFELSHLTLCIRTIVKDSSDIIRALWLTVWVWQLRAECWWTHRGEMEGWSGCSRPLIPKATLRTMKQFYLVLWCFFHLNSSFSAALSQLSECVLITCILLYPDISIDSVWLRDGL